MNILVTGGAGYIGSHTIIEILEQTDWTPISVDDHRNSSPDAYARIEEVSGKKVKSYEIDLSQTDGIGQIFKDQKIDGVIHFAALKMVGESVDRPLLYYQNNVNSLVNVLSAQKKHGIKHHIFSSSCSVYGNSKNALVTEDTPLERAESPYAYTKVLGERILEDLAVTDPLMNIIALRYFNPVGAHESGRIGELPIGVPNNLVPYITQTAIGLRDSLTIFGDDYETRDGTCIRDYVHVSDIANAHVKALKYLFDRKNNTPMEIINLGTGNGISVKETVESFERVNGLKLPHHYGPRRAGDVVAVYADPSKAKRLLGWSADRSVDEMMRSAWAWEQHYAASVQK